MARSIFQEEPVTTSGLKLNAWNICAAFTLQMYKNPDKLIASKNHPEKLAKSYQDILKHAFVSLIIAHNKSFKEKSTSNLRFIKEVLILMLYKQPNFLKVFVEAIIDCCKSDDDKVQAACFDIVKLALNHSIKIIENFEAQRKTTDVDDNKKLNFTSKHAKEFFKLFLRRLDDLFYQREWYSKSAAIKCFTFFFEDVISKSKIKSKLQIDYMKILSSLEFVIAELAGNINCNTVNLAKSLYKTIALIDLGNFFPIDKLMKNLVSHTESLRSLSYDVIEEYSKMKSDEFGKLVRVEEILLANMKSVTDYGPPTKSHVILKHQSIESQIGLLNLNCLLAEAANLTNSKDYKLEVDPPGQLTSIFFSQVFEIVDRENPQAKSDKTDDKNENEKDSSEAAIKKTKFDEKYLQKREFCARILATSSYIEAAREKVCQALMNFFIWCIKNEKRSSSAKSSLVSYLNDCWSCEFKCENINKFLVTKFNEAIEELTKLNNSEKPGNKQLKEWVELVALLKDLPFKINFGDEFVEKLFEIFMQPVGVHFPTSAEITNRKLVLECLSNCKALSSNKLNGIFQKIQELKDGPGIDLNFEEGLVDNFIKNNFNSTIKLIDSESGFSNNGRNLPFVYLVQFLENNQLPLTDSDFAWHSQTENENLLITLLLKEKRIRIFQNSADWLLTKISMKRINVEHEDFRSLIIKCCKVYKTDQTRLTNFIFNYGLLGELNISEKLGRIDDLAVKRKESECMWKYLNSRDVMFAFLELVESSYGNLTENDKLKLLVRLINPIMAESLPKFKAQNNNLTIYETFDIVSSMLNTWIKPVIVNQNSQSSINRHLLLQLYRLIKIIITHASDQLPTNTPKFNIIMELVNLSGHKSGPYYKDNLIRCYSQEVMCLLVDKIIDKKLGNPENYAFIESLFEDLCQFQTQICHQTEQMKKINKHSIKILLSTVSKKFPEKLVSLRKIFTKIYQETMESSIIYSQIAHLLSVFNDNFDDITKDCFENEQIEAGFIELLFRIIKKLIMNLDSSGISSLNTLSQVAPSGQFPQNTNQQMQTVNCVSDINQKFEYRLIITNSLQKLIEGYQTKKIILYSGQIQLLLDFIVKIFVQIKVLINPGMNKFGLYRSDLEDTLLKLAKLWVEEFARNNGNFFCWGSCCSKPRSDVGLLKLTDTLQVFGVLFGFYIEAGLKIPKNDEFFWELIDLKYSCEVTSQINSPDSKNTKTKPNKNDKKLEPDVKKQELKTVNVYYVNFIHMLSKILPVYLYNCAGGESDGKIESFVINSVISLDEKMSENNNSEKLDDGNEDKSVDDKNDVSIDMGDSDNSKQISSGIVDGSLEEIVSSLSKNLVLFSCFRAYLLNNLSIFDKEDLKDTFYPALIKYSIKLTREHTGSSGSTGTFGSLNSNNNNSIFSNQNTSFNANFSTKSPLESAQKFNQIYIQRLITKVLTICLEILCVKIGNISQHKKSILSQIMLVVSDKTSSNQVLYTILKMLNAWVIQRTPGAEIGYDTETKRKEEIQEYLIKNLELPSLVEITPQARGHQEQCPVSIRELAHHFCKVSTHIEKLVNRTNIGTNPNLKGEGVGELKGFSDLKNEKGIGFNIYGSNPFQQINQEFLKDKWKTRKQNQKINKTSGKGIPKLEFGMFRSMQFEYDFIEQESLKYLVSDLAKLVAAVYKDEGLAGTEITTRLESAFNMSICVVTGKLHIEDPALFSIKNDLIKTLTTHVKRKPSDRLAYIFASHNWEFMGQRYWIPHCIDMILGCLEPGNHFIPPEIMLDGDEGKNDLNLPKDLRKADEYINGLVNKLTLSKLLPGIVSLCYISKELSHRFWLRFFPSVWKSCGVKGRQSIVRLG